MKISQRKAFSRRKFIFVGLFLNLMILVTTAIIIQIFEAFEEDFFIHLFLVVHIFSGLVFTVLTVIHTLMNWQWMKIYTKTKDLIIGKEAIYALLLTMMAILASILFVAIFLN